MTYNYELLVNFSFIIQLLIFSSTVALIKRFHHPGFYPLLAISIAFLLAKTDDLLQLTGLALNHPNWLFSGGLVTLLLGPFIYFYVRARTDSQLTFKISMLLHCVWIVPAAIYLMINWWPFDAQEKITLLTSGALNNQTTLLLLPSYSDIILIIYLFLSIRLLLAHGVRLQLWFSNIEDRNLSGLRYLLTMFAVMVAMHLIWNLGRYYLIGSTLNSIVISLLVTYHLILINGLFIEFMTHKYSKDKQDSALALEQKEPSRAIMQLSSAQLSTLTKTLTQILNDDQLYLNPDLTLVDLAKTLKIHARTASELINQYEKCNFHEYINRHRIDHAKNEIKQNPKKSILQVAYDSGFNSKSAFNTAFKRFVQLTPSGYRNVCKDSSS